MAARTARADSFPPLTGFDGSDREALARSPLMRADGLRDEDRVALAKALTAPVRVRAGADLVREGQPTDRIWLLLDGWACRYVTGRDGTRRLPAVLLPGDLCNVDCLLLDPPDFGVCSLGKATLTSLSRDDALALNDRHPAIARAFLRLALGENAILTRWMARFGRRNAMAQVAHLLCELEARLDDTEHGPVRRIHLPLTQENVADVVGLTPVHVNRTLKQLRDAGAIVSEGRTITIPDLARLRAIAQFDPGYLHDAPEDARGAASRPDQVQRPRSEVVGTPSP